MRYFYFVVCLFCLLLFNSTLSFALEVIIDNDNPSCTVVGTWDVSTSNCYGLDKYTHAPGTGTEYVTWIATLEPGWYVVHFRMNSNTGYATDAHYSITHRDGTDNKTIIQQRGSSGWFVLGGAYYFDGTATVTLTDAFTSGTLVVADGMRFRSIFSFVQMSDSHVGYGQGTSDTTDIANELKTLGKVTMATYGFDAPPPSFAIHSGDFTEYGQESWNTLMNIFTGMPFNVYFVPGNHDSTWSSCREKIRSRHGAPYYTFDHYDQGTRFHFVCMNSPVIQSPRAGFSRDELDFLASDLASLAPNTVSFINIHHPINGASDPKPFDAYRLLETIKPYNVPIIFYGHGHSNNQTTFDNIRLVQGGSTYSDSTVGNYNIITVMHDRVHVAKKVYADATAATGVLNNMLIPSSPSYPTITVTEPIKDSTHTSSTLNVTASISGASGTVTAVDFELNDDDLWRSMSGSGDGPYTGSVNLSGSVHGRHWIRVRFTMSSGGPWYKMVPFWHWDNYPQIKWIVDLGASSLSMPALYDDKVYVGMDGGKMRCVNMTDGSDGWTVTLPSDVISSPAVADGKVIFGCGNSKVYCLDAYTGTQLWEKTCSGPMYSSPTIDGSSVYIGSIGTGSSSTYYLYSLNITTGAENWKYSAAYAIETKPFVLSGTVFFGSWDSYFYALNTSNGSLKWRYQRNSNRYYSPGDSWPVASASANRVFVADREYYLNTINITTGIADLLRTSISSQALTPDGTGLIQRVTSGNLERTTFDNANVWSRACSLDSAPVSPICNGNRAVIVDQDGLVSVVNVNTSAIEYQFYVARGYQLHPVNIDSNGNVYASTYEGFLMCVTNNPVPAETNNWTIYE